MWAIKMGEAVLLRATETPATVIGIAEYQDSETMYLVTFAGEGGIKTSQWRNMADLEPVTQAE